MIDFERAQLRTGNDEAARRFMLAKIDRALIAGARFARELASLRAGEVSEPGFTGGPHESMRINGAALAELVSMLMMPGLPDEGSELVDAVAELLSGVDEITLDAWYVDDGVRLRGRVEFR